MNHTKEPWHTGGNGTIVYDTGGWGVASATVFHGRDKAGEAVANAERIVACVNACAGMIDPSKEIAELRQQLAQQPSGHIVDANKMVQQSSVDDLNTFQPTQKDILAQLYEAANFLPVGGLFGVIGNAIQELQYYREQPSVDVLDAAKAVVERWDTPLWKDVPHTAIFIHKLRDSLQAMNESKPEKD